MLISDASQREKAIDVSQSFIVQAPAGSGKTELLTQRFLALLGKVARQPEEILAITFTKKAAGEMRERIMAALAYAKHHPLPSEPHQQTTWHLAQQVLIQDKKYGWRLLENPNRFKITTIDAFCRSIAVKLPILSTMGSEKNIADNPLKLYQKAAHATLNHLHSDDPWFEAIKTLLMSVDNDFERAESLIIDMLETRDQWLSYLGISGEDLLNHLRRSLQNIIHHTLEKAHHIIQASFPLDEFITLVNFAYHQCVGKSFEMILPAPHQDFLVWWQFVGELFLTDEGEVRKSLTKAQGFPASSSTQDKTEKLYFADMKARMLALLERARKQPALVQQFREIQLLPSADYYDDPLKKQKIFSLFDLLKLAYAELKVVFQTLHQVDFTEIAICANIALSQTNEITDINLMLDYQLKHILIDEFQDTSHLQFSLLENLTQEWMPDGDKTVFLVGDPMQSIYRFRQAEVGLFLQVQEKGLNQLNLIPLTLSCNFRSEPNIVKWINEQFTHAFPPESDMASGAIHYSASTPTTMVNHAQLDQQQPLVTWHRLHEPRIEPFIIAACIQTIQRQTPEAKIAVLGRKRKHLIPIMGALNILKIPYQAVEIESLAQKQTIQDLIALTCALHHLADHVSWLSILRFPCVNLALEDLLQLASLLPQKTVLEILNQQDSVNTLSSAGKQILKQITPILNLAVSERGRFPIRQWIEQTWIALGGKTTIQTENHLLHAEHFFEFIENTSLEMVDIYTLKNALETKFATMSNLSAKVQCMTIHKSKGLEFDYVILPQLMDSGQTDSANILAWHAQPSTYAEKSHHYDWLLAPKKAIGDESDKMYNYIRQINQEKNHHEITRLLYVAATRAKKGVHLFYHMLVDDKAKPAKDSLMAPIIESYLHVGYCQHRLYHEEDNNTYMRREHPADSSPKIANFMHKDIDLFSEDNEPIQLLIHASSSLADNADFKFEFHWEIEKQLGSVYHMVLKWLADDPKLQDKKNINILKTKISHLLYEFLIPIYLHTTYLDEIIQTLTNLFECPRAKWILSNQHQDAHAEYAVSIVQANQPKHFMIDRTFIDKTGIRWIIDYKTTLLKNSSEIEFLNQAWQDHEKQLKSYASFFEKVENKPIQLGLFFPRQGLWTEKTDVATLNRTVQISY